jgi:lipooligosaccharide transport system permease protein
VSAVQRVGVPTGRGQGGGTPVRVWRVIETEWVNYRRTWRGSVSSAFLGPLLYLGAIGFGLGSLVEADGAGLGADGSGEPLGYVAFLAPGLIAATAMQVAAGEGIFGTMARLKWRRTWETAVETPLAPLDVALAHVVWCAFRAAIAAAAYALVTSLFGVLSPLQAVAAVVPATLGGVALAAPLFGVMARTTEEHMMNAMQRFVVIPMFLFSGVFFPVAQLPGWMQAIAMATPLWHAVVLARALALGTPTPWAAWVHVTVLVVVLVLGTAWAVRGLQRRLIA